MSIKTVKLGDVIDVLSGFAFKSEFFGDADGFPIIRIRDVVRGYTDTYYAGPYTEQFVVQNGDIVIGMDGNFNAAKWQGGLALLNQRVCKVTAKAQLIDEGYLFHYLPIVLKKIEDATPFVTVKHLSAGDLKGEAIPLPPLPEQRRIAAVLDKADALRTKRREALAQLDRLAQSIFVEMFGDPVTNPKGWPVYPMSTISTFENGDRSSNYPSGEDIKSEGVLFLSTKNIKNYQIDLSSPAFITAEKFNSLSRGKARSDDILITLRGTLGNCCIFRCEHEKAFINAQMMIVRAGNTVIPDYLLAVLSSTHYQNTFERMGQGAAVPQLTATQLALLEIAVPPLELQNQFLQRTQMLRGMGVVQQEAMVSCDELFESLQHRAFRGEL